MARGKLTGKVNQCAEAKLGRPITQVELRLMPYIQHVMMNNQRLEPKKISPEEREVLSRWRKLGWVNGGAAGMVVSKDFWDAMNEILWMAYVAYEETETV